MIIEHLIDASGLTALALSVRASLAKSDRTLGRTSLWASTTWAFNHLLIGAPSAAALSLLAAGRQAGLAALGRHQARLKRLVFAGTVAATLAVGALTWAGPVTLLPLAASLIATTAVFQLAGWALRAAMMPVNLLWVGNALVFDSAWQVAAGAIGFAAAAIGAWRSRRQPIGDPACAGCGGPDDDAATPGCGCGAECLALLG